MTTRLGAIALVARAVFFQTAFAQLGSVSMPYAVVSNEGSHDISLLSESGDLLYTLRLPSRPRGIAFSKDGRRVFVALSDDRPNTEATGDAIAEVDLQARRIVRRISAGTDPETFAITPDERTLFSSNEDAGTASATDLRTGKVSATLVVGIEPEGVAASPDGRWVYVTAETSNSVSMIDAKTKRVVANVLVDARPRGVVFTPNGRMALVSAEIGGTLSIIDVRSHSLSDAVTLQQGRGKPVGIAVSPDSKFAFVANGATHSVSVVDLIGGRRSRRSPSASARGESQSPAMAGPSTRRTEARTTYRSSMSQPGGCGPP